MTMLVETDTIRKMTKANLIELTNQAFEELLCVYKNSLAYDFDPDDEHYIAEVKEAKKILLRFLRKTPMKHLK
ncbi:hypothetical protein LCGC14_1112550 [marine sediment metagenome]|uniref:Uncharacterized protein n=1 Tax=marine sediment metagenome TaxID=412755 RepID=A0A0F9QCF0_9ZZZZ